MENKEYINLMNHFGLAQKICAPDEYYKKQRDLLYELTAYILQRDEPEDMKAKRLKDQEETKKAFEWLKDSKNEAK